jgi:hypothetical protein
VNRRSWWFAGFAGDLSIRCNRAVISDDLAKLHEYQNNPSQWKR